MTKSGRTTKVDLPDPTSVDLDEAIQHLLALTQTVTEGSTTEERALAAHEAWAYAMYVLCPVLAGERRGLVRQLRGTYSYKELAELLGVNDSRIGQLLR
jgi:DNA-directed RNA polymerase specialized sigma24 family protein